MLSHNIWKYLVHYILIVHQHLFLVMNSSCFRVMVTGSHHQSPSLWSMLSQHFLLCGWQHPPFYVYSWSSSTKLTSHYGTSRKDLMNKKSIIFWFEGRCWNMIENETNIRIETRCNTYLMQMIWMVEIWSCKKQL